MRESVGNKLISPIAQGIGASIRKPYTYSCRLFLYAILFLFVPASMSLSDRTVPEFLTNLQGCMERKSGFCAGLHYDTPVWRDTTFTKLNEDRSLFKDKTRRRICKVCDALTSSGKEPAWGRDELGGNAWDDLARAVIDWYSPAAAAKRPLASRDKSNQMRATRPAQATLEDHMGLAFPALA